MDFNKQPQKIISLCTGIRGLERGIERSGTNLQPVCYVEIESFIMQNLVAGMEAGLVVEAAIWSNLKTFPWESFHGKVHGIIGGYPCQPFSVAGNQRGEEDPRHLWPYIAAGIRAVKPLWCFFENVPGHLNIGYETVRRELQEMGYHVEEGVFSAEEVGAPHKRQRLFILAVGNPYRDQQRSQRGDNGKMFGFQEKERTEFSTSLSLRASEKLGNTESNNERNDSNIRHGEESIGRASSELANSDNERLQGWKCRELCQCSGECIIRPSDPWPARPGQNQHSWEEPRTVESGLGCTINGYNFREDLIRALGNGVVEQTCELAWDLLWEKQFKNL